MTNLHKVLFATGVALTIIIGLLFGAHLAARSASTISNTVGSAAIPMTTALHQMRFGIARVVSSVNEIIVLSASRAQPMKNETEDHRNSEEHKQEADEHRAGRDLYVSALADFKRVLPTLGLDKAGIYAPLISDIEFNYTDLREFSDTMIESAESGFDPVAISELKEEFEEKEQAALSAIEKAIKLSEGDERRLINAGIAAIERLEFLTTIITVISGVALIIYATFMISILRSEAAARQSAEQTNLSLAEAIKRVGHETGQRLKLEKRLAHANKMEALGVLAGGAAHELNNQLMPILSMATMIHDRMSESDADRRKIELICLSAENARNTVLKILKFSVGEDQVADTCAVSGVCQDIKDIFLSTCPANIRAAFDIAEDIGVVSLASDDFRSVISNLLYNAVDAYDGRPGDISIVVEATDLGLNEIQGLAKGKYAKITVTDKASGIKPENINQIFDPFFSTKVVGQGVGLGLSIVHGLVTNLGGNVGVESVPGQGTTFRVYLPLAEPI